MKIGRFGMRIAATGMMAALATMGLAQLQRAWVQAVDGGTKQNNEGTSALIDSAGNVYAVGTVGRGPNSNDFLTAKFSPSGAKLWEYQTALGNPKYGYPWVTKFDAEGNLITVGWANIDPNDYDIVVTKISPDGVPIFATTWDGEGGQDIGYGLAIDPSGNIYAVGHSTAPNGTVNIVLLKLAPNGAILWERTYLPPGASKAFGFVAETDGLGGVYVAGSSISSSNDSMLLRYDFAGNLLWAKSYDGPAHLSDDIWDLGVDGSGNAVVLSDTESVTRFDVLLQKYAPDGTLLWSQTWDSQGSDDIGIGLSVNGSGEIAVSGYTTDRNALLYAFHQRYDSEGNLLWTKKFSDTQFWGFNNATGAKINENGESFVTGRLYGGSYTADDMFVAKYDAAGNELFFDRYDNPSHSSDLGYSLALGPDDSFAVVGDTSSPATGADILVVRYAPVAVQRLAPTAFTVLRGSTVSGGLADLVSSDDQYLVVRNGPVALPSEAPITVIIDGMTPQASASFLSVRMESKVSIANLQQQIDMYDWVANSYNKLDTRAAQTTDQVVDITADDPSRYVDANRNLRVRIRIRPGGVLFTNNWRLSIDQTEWSWLP